MPNLMIIHRDRCILKSVDKDTNLYFRVSISISEPKRSHKDIILSIRSKMSLFNVLPQMSSNESNDVFSLAQSHIKILFGIVSLLQSLHYQFADIIHIGLPQCFEWTFHT